MQKSPSPAKAWAIAAGYTAVLLLLSRILGGNYAEIKAADSAGDFLLTLVVPMAVMATLLWALTSWLGWWPAVLNERLPVARWLLAVPALYLVGELAQLATRSWGSQPWLLVACLALGTLLVGFNEEVVFRGLMVVGLRARHGEALVCLYTSLAFGLVHGANFFLGQGLGDTLVQMVTAFFTGFVLYVVRRATGTILACVALHALWDFAALVTGPSGPGSVALTTQVLYVLPATSLVGVVVLSLVGLRGLFSASRPADARIR